MYHDYCRTNLPDGEIFFDCRPKRENRGIGSALLAEMEQRKKGRLIYLYTANACTYLFYMHKGFDKVGVKAYCNRLKRKESTI